MKIILTAAALLLLPMQLKAEICHAAGLNNYTVYKPKPQNAVSEFSIFNLNTVTNCTRIGAVMTFTHAINGKQDTNIVLRTAAAKVVFGYDAKHNIMVKFTGQGQCNQTYNTLIEATVLEHEATVTCLGTTYGGNVKFGAGFIFTDH